MRINKQKQRIRNYDIFHSFGGMILWIYGAWNGGELLVATHLPRQQWIDRIQPIVDLQRTQAFRNYISLKFERKSLKSNGKTFVISTHTASPLEG